MTRPINRPTLLPSSGARTPPPEQPDKMTATSRPASGLRMV